MQATKRMPNYQMMMMMMMMMMMIISMFDHLGL